MIAIQPRSAKHLVLSRLSDEPQTTASVLSRVQAQQVAALQAVSMSEELLLRHLRVLMAAGYADSLEDDHWRLTDLGEIALEGLGIWRARRAGAVDVRLSLAGAP